MWFYFKDKPNFYRHNWTHIVIHHTASPDTKYLDFEALSNYHMSYRIDGNIVTQEEFEKRKLLRQGRTFETPWLYIGYNFVIDKINDKYEIITGRPLNMDGAHTLEQDMNKIGISIACVGNYDTDIPADEMLQKVAVLCRSLMDQFMISVDNIKGHNFYAQYKTCPGKNFNIDNFKKTHLLKI